MSVLRLAMGVIGSTLVICCAGCLPVLIGGAFYHDAQKKKSREHFMASFHATNVEREENGLPPLDLCTEKYQYDPGWAKRDPACRERIRRYENGETEALGSAAVAQRSKGGGH